MASVRTSRRGHGEDSIYFDAEKNRHVGAVSLGHGGDGTRVCRKVYGKTKQDVRLKLKSRGSGIRSGHLEFRPPAISRVVAGGAGPRRRSPPLQPSACWPATLGRV